MDFERIRPINGHVLIKVEERVQERPGSPIIMPATATGRPNRAVVVAAAQDGKEGLRQGDRVIFDAYRLALVFGDGQMANAAGTPIARAGDYVMIHEDAIHAVDE